MRVRLDAVDVFLDILDALSLLEIGDEVGVHTFLHVPHDGLEGVGTDKVLLVFGAVHAD